MEISMDDDQKPRRMLGDYSDWVRHQGDVDFDFKWHIMQMIALLLALIGSFFFIMHIFFL